MRRLIFYPKFFKVSISIASQPRFAPYPHLSMISKASFQPIASPFQGLTRPTQPDSPKDTSIPQEKGRIDRNRTQT